MRWDKIIFTVARRSQLLVPAHVRSTTRFQHAAICYTTKCYCCHSLCSNMHKKALVSNLTSENNCLLHFTFTVANIRGYAKGKDRGRDKKKMDKGKKKVEISDEKLAEVIKVENMRTQMQKAVDRMKEEYIKNLSLRSTTGSIETVQVSLDGKEYELQELAQIVRKNPKTIVVNMSVFPQAIPAALQAIQKSGLNLNPQQDGTTLFIPVPKVTKEHRETLAKNAKALFIKCRDSVRDVQNKFVKTVKNNGNISEDLSHQVQEQVWI
ncbi:hypothetical protein L9F63_012079, partial [Diploptera punctata]